MYRKYIKRILDIFFAVVGLLILSPLLLVAAFAIKNDSWGTVLIRQKRFTRSKMQFTVFKLRTMYDFTPENPNDMLPDLNIYLTKVGKLLRKCSLDEAVQLLNVIGGSMSIIGPRPALFSQEDLIAERDKHGANDVKPGMIGWVGIRGRVGLSIEEKAKLDGEYAQNATFIMDCKCLFGAIKNALGY